MMKFCDVPFKFVYFDYFDGRVMLCPWMRNPDGCPGNVFKDELGTIWNNEHSQNIRNSILDGSFNLCRPDACPHLQNKDLPDVKEEQIREIVANATRPTHFNLAYDFVCNQFCETCRPQKFKICKDYHKIMHVMDMRISPWLTDASYISASGHGDPFASPYTLKILSELRPANPDMQILLETNGVYFDEAHWRRIAHLANHDLRVIITVNSFDPWTYSHISRGGNYEQLMRNLKFVSSLREENKIRRLTLTMVIQDRNFREMPAFAQRCLSEYKCDQVLLRPVYQWGTMPDDVYWYKDVLNPAHPYHPEYLELREHPALKDKRVYNFAGKSVHPRRNFPARIENGY